MSVIDTAISHDTLMNRAVETMVADILDDVDSSLSTLRHRDEVIANIETVLTAEEKASVLNRVNGVLAETTHYSSGMPYSFEKATFGNDAPWSMEMPA